MQPAPRGKEVNDILVESIDDMITALLSRQVVEALYVHLQGTYSISKDEVPYKLETLCATLERTFGLSGSITIGKAIARKFYGKLGLTFSNHPGRTLLEYVEEAKIKLREDEGQL